MADTWSVGSLLSGAVELLSRHGSLLSVHGGLLSVHGGLLSVHGGLLSRRGALLSRHGGLLSRRGGGGYCPLTALSCPFKQVIWPMTITQAENHLTDIFIPNPSVIRRSPSHVRGASSVLLHLWRQEVVWTAFSWIVFIPLAIS